MRVPRPHRNYDKVTDITPQALRALGVSGVLLDIDGTLMRTKDAEPSAEIIAWCGALRQAGILPFILSNNKHPQRVARFGALLEADYIYLAKKPAQHGFLEAARRMNLPPERLALIGDQIYTDMLGARRFGCLALRVRSLDTYLWYWGLRRIAELPFLAAEVRS